MNEGSITLVRDPWTVPERIPVGDTAIVPFYGGRTLSWRLVDPYSKMSTDTP